MTHCAADASVSARAARVRLMIFDVDGVLTDGSLLFTREGDAMKPFNSLDGHGVKLLREAGIGTAIITGRRSEIVARRAQEMGIAHLFQGVEHKSAAFAQLLAAVQDGEIHAGARIASLAAPLAPAACGYMGDDWPDLAVMLQCGFAAAPANAHPEVRARAHWVSQARGGHGAVREVCDLLLRAGGHYDALLAHACAAVDANAGAATTSTMK